MPTKRSPLSWLSALACLALAVPALAASPGSLVATVQRVLDGDIITAISANGPKLRIRLLGIDAPEIPHGNKPGQPYGEEARDYLDHLIGGKMVHVDAYGPDRYKPRYARTGGQPGLVRWSQQGGLVYLADLLIYHKRPRPPRP